MKPIISVNEARKILGKEAKECTNKQVEEIIHSMDEIAKYFINEHKKGNIKLKNIRK